MPRFLAYLCFLVALPMCAADAARYFLSSGILIADDTPDPRFEPASEWMTVLEHELDRAMPGQRIQLSTQRLLSPHDRALWMVPRVAAARVTHEVVSGSIHDHAAILVADLAVIDPWSGATIYSATRLLSGSARLTVASGPAVDDALRAAFRQAWKEWSAAAIEELKARLSPFQLEAGMAQLPGDARVYPGGVWPVGSLQGLKERTTVTAVDGRIFRVRAVLPRYSWLESAADPESRIEPGLICRQILPMAPAERPEPRLRLEWFGPPLHAPSGLDAPSLPPAALLGLLQQYASKDSALRVLPVTHGTTKAEWEFLKLQAEVSRYSKAVRHGLMTLQRESLLRIAAEDADFRVRLGVLNAYAGSRPTADGAKEHQYRLTLFAAVEQALPGSASPRYVLRAVFDHTESMARVAKAGIRELDPSALWFTLQRNAVIRLSTRILEGRGAWSGEPGSACFAVVESGGGVTWRNGEEPLAGQPLEWFRPAGRLSESGEDLLAPMTPTAGFLNARQLGQEKVKPNDRVRHHRRSTPRPVLALALPTVEDVPSWLPSPYALAVLAAKELARESGHEVAIEPTDEATPWAARAVTLRVSAQSLERLPTQWELKGEWRMTASGGDSDLVKAGVASSTRAPRADAWTSQDLPVQAYAENALHSLAVSAANKGLRAAPRSTSPTND
jgi:hypothetical protein